MRFPCREPSTPVDDLVDVEEPVLFQADLDERSLHARQHVVHAAEVDVAGDRPAFRALEIDLGNLAVFEDGDALFADVDGDEQLTLRSRKRRAARGLPPAALLAAPAERSLRCWEPALLGLRA